MAAASVSVTHANHIGFLAYYTMMAAKENMIGLAICNAGACTAVWGTNQRVLGTDPLSVALPALNHPSVVFDAATSVVAQGKSGGGRHRGKAHSGQLGVRARRPNPPQPPPRRWRGPMRPFGDYKGSGLAIIIALITAGLGGVAFDMEQENLLRIRERTRWARTCRISLWWSTSPPLLMSPRSAAGSIPSSTLSRRFGPAPGFDEILMPGEIEWRKCEKARAGGFEIGENLYHVLRQTNRDLGFEYDISAWEH